MKVKIISGHINLEGVYYKDGSIKPYMSYAVQVGSLHPQRVTIWVSELKEMSKEQVFEYIKEALGLNKLKGIENDVTGEEFEI